ncbi:hypothetical protein [Niabella ginsengisoli]|uniref:Uncharacterized protein n=1 Tax=Niabella ginsengisoli TaxID=522298 RepID=A0ABS9SJH9_9BACT|nr:hypothetical protein [Niabella ginsengisoli]MCH5598542.1 hypothetical protein [Niabella ginsengisoli]
MKKFATKFVLVAASTFVMGTVMAQTDTTQTPQPDTTQTPTPEPTEPTDTTSTPTPPTAMMDSSASADSSVSNKTVSLAAQFSQFNNTFYAITNKELLSAKQYDMKAEEEKEA